MKKYRELLLLLMQTCLLVCITVVAVLPVSCKMSEEGVTVYDGDYSAPVIESIEVLDEKTVQMNFSEGVKIGSVVVSKFIGGISDSILHSDTEKVSDAIEAAGGEFGRLDVEAEVSEDGLTVTYTMQEDCEVGEPYEIFGTVEDEIGNSLTFCVPFTGYNSRVPDLIFTEVQIKYAKGSEKGNVVYRGEFVELLALCDGNLGGLELVGGADGESKKFVFPAVEVSQGELIMVHLRTVGEGCVNELGENLDEATAPYAVPGVRNLWSENTTARYNDDSDVIILRNSATESVLEAFMYAVEDASEWKKGPVVLAKEAAAAGIYDGEGIEYAAINYKTTPKKSFIRLDASQILSDILEGNDYVYPINQCAENWEVGNVTPGTL